MHAVQVASPALENVFAGHEPHTVLLVAVQFAVGALPAAQTVQGAQGPRPEALYATPAGQGKRAQELLDAFHA
jgi:hypothetical protein